MKKMLKYIFVGTLLIISISCKKNDLYNILKDKYLDCNNTKEKCIIDFNKDLENLIEEDWDTVYIIENADLSILESLTDKENFLFSESMPKILFVKDLKIVYQECYETNIGQIRKGLLLDYNLNPYLIVDRKKAQFLIFPMDKDNINHSKDALYIKLNN